MNMSQFLQSTVLILAMIIPFHDLSANINVINFKEIPDFDKMSPGYDFLIKNLRYYDTWVHEWKHDVSRDSLITGLKEIYAELKRVEETNQNNFELQLLLGDICHYLYNLEEEEYGGKALGHYKRAESINSRDYRPIWFRARHISLTGNLKNGIFEFKKIIDHLQPDIISPFFWEDYAYAAHIACMPSNSVMAMDNVKSMTGKPCYFDTVLGNKIRDSIKTTPVSAGLQASKDQWIKVPDERKLINRLFGFRLDLADGWDFKYTGSDKKNAAVISFLPPKDKGNSEMVGSKIGFFAEVFTDQDSLASVTESFLKRFKKFKISKININSKYKNATVHDIFDPNINKPEGGGHVIIFITESDQPERPGVKIEYPITAPKSSNSKVSYYRIKDKLNRFQGKIYYIMILYSPTSILDNSKKNFEKLINEMLLIE